MRLAAILYLFSFGLFLANDGIFWDDWILVNNSQDVLVEEFSQAGAPWVGYLHAWMNQVVGVFGYRILSFFCYLLAIVCIGRILSRLSILKAWERDYLLIFTACLPFNHARIAMITFIYALCYAAFFVGLWCLQRYCESKQLLFRLGALILFFFSFQTGSFLVFYVVPLALLIFYKKGLSWRDSDFLLLPILSWTLRKLFYTSYGLFAGDNSFSLRALIFPLDTLQMVLETGFYFFWEWMSWELLALCVSITFFTVRFFPNIPQETESKNCLIKRFGVGVLLFTLGLFPYLAVHKFPHFREWTSRHQLLLSFGMGTSLIYGVVLIARRQARFILAGLAILFTLQNIGASLEYQFDTIKQEAVLEQLAHHPQILEASTLIFIDNTEDLNAKHRTYRFYEFSGMMASLFGDQSRLGILKENFSKNHWQKQCGITSRNLGDYQIQPPDYEVSIHSNKLREKSFASWIYLYWMQQERFSHEISQALTFKIQPAKEK